MTNDATIFEFTGYDVDTASGIASFSYAISFADGTRETFRETLKFVGTTPEQWSSIPPALLNPMLECIHLALGVSYWKLHCPPQIQLDRACLTPGQAAYWKTVYTKGLGEFFYKNKLDFHDRIHFPTVAACAAGIETFSRSARVLVPFGGGKDSLVTLELLKQKGFAIAAFALAPAPLQQELAAIAGVPLITVERTLDSKLLTAAHEGRGYNGHIPISTIYTWVSVLVAALHDFHWVAFSNEASASEGNREYLGEEINHQWSKSQEAETLVRDYLRAYLTNNILPFSLLRPCSELAITQRFAALEKYHSAFSSCNRNFAINTARRLAGERRWCGTCPKCAFVFTALAAFVPKDALVDIFGKNLFADEALLPTYRDLLGIGEAKPFECVGTAKETAVAFHRAAKSGTYNEDAAIQMFTKEVLPKLGDIDALERDVLQTGDLSTLPEEFRGIFG